MITNSLTFKGTAALVHKRNESPLFFACDPDVELETYSFRIYACKGEPIALYEAFDFLMRRSLEAISRALVYHSKGNYSTICLLQDDLAGRGKNWTYLRLFLRVPNKATSMVFV